MIKYDKIQCISSLWFQPGTWNPFFYGHICKSLLSWSLFQATSARRPRLHGLQTMELLVAAMSHLILIKCPKRGHNKWFSNPLDIFEHVWTWSPVTKSGVDFGAHTVRRKGTHHLDDALALRDGDCFSMTCPLHRSTGAPWAIPRSHTCQVLVGSVSDSMMSVLVDDVGWCGILSLRSIWWSQFIHLYYPTYWDHQNPWQELKRNSEEHWHLGSTTLCTVRNNSVPDSAMKSIACQKLPLKLGWSLAVNFADQWQAV